MTSHVITASASRGAMLSPAISFILVTSVVLLGEGTYGTHRFQIGTSNIQWFDTGLQSKISPVNDAKENEFPFAVYIVRKRERLICSGSLIERRWVITAGHCIKDYATHVVLGAVDRNTNATSSKQLIGISEQIRHPGYVGNETMLLNDIGLIRLATPANIKSDAISKVALLKSKSLKAKFLANEKLCKSLGWGMQVNNKVWSVVTRLQQLEVRFVNDSEVMERATTVFPDFLFNEAVYTTNCQTDSPCNGDSGGPLVCMKGGSWKLVAMTSYGAKLEEGCIRGIFGTTDVELFVPWIESVISA